MIIYGWTGPPLFDVTIRIQRERSHFHKLEIEPGSKLNALAITLLLCINLVMASLLTDCLDAG